MAEEKAYIGVSACGCVSAAMVVGSGGKREEAAELKRWMRSGRSVEIVSVDEARSRLASSCTHRKAPGSPEDINATALRLVEEGRNG